MSGASLKYATTDKLYLGWGEWHVVIDDQLLGASFDNTSDQVSVKLWSFNSHRIWIKIWTEKGFYEMKLKLNQQLSFAIQIPATTNLHLSSK